MNSSIPQISISLAPAEELPEEPRSPFSPSSWAVIPDEEGFRPQHLSPMSAGSPSFPKVLSPLRPADVPVKGAGLERQRFEALLKASKERSSATGARKAADLRKEIALKAHKSKHVDRRALFLSKLQAPPSASAVLTPITPPESPAIFHYTLPSPGLNSPLSLFDAVNGTSDATGIQPWTEEIDFRKMAPEKQAPPRPRNKALPSLDEITGYLSSHGHMPQPPQAETPRARPTARLPAFLTPSLARAEAEAPPRRLRADVGRLRVPVRALTISAPKPLIRADAPTPVVRIPSIPSIAVTAPSSPAAPDGSRMHTAKRMLSTLQRRTVTQPPAGDEVKEWRRRSAPAELQQGRARAGFMHPVLAMPGGF
ncbi:hypothetical protein FIBSPDRAFT_723055 [Athelia psychrophila]|uniref:Uncharacterized protein n=1 Tax=Athelia psychrophila TaxID=1759441 RepID=A0A166V4M1_9AGAM|nr:hypothetical protein FIBSPDRAFT_723055 [Fibularhizoctonia sp. CBS 109695]